MIKITSDEQLEALKRSGLTRVDDFLKTGKSNHTVHGYPLVLDGNDCLYLIADGRMGYIGCWRRAYDKPDSRAKILDLHCDWEGLEHWEGVTGDSIQGAVVPTKKSGQQFLLVQDGDEDGSKLVGIKNEKLATTVSFQCLAELLRLPDSLDASLEVASGKVAIVASTPDESKPVSAAVKEKIRSLRKSKKTASDIRDALKPPQAGLTLVGLGSSGKAAWHRSATVLLSNGKKTYLIGQDEGTYFGCELADNPKTIDDAYTSLTPKEARVAGVKRQGEWFAVPVLSTKVPPESDCLASGQDGDHSIVLQRQTPDDNKHELYVEHGGEYRIDSTGVFASGCELRHEEHETMKLPRHKWFKFFRNTAVRSVSQEGVD